MTTTDKSATASQSPVVETVTLFRHVTTGGAVYLTDNHRFIDAHLVIRLDGGPELLGCKYA